MVTNAISADSSAPTEAAGQAISNGDPELGKKFSRVLKQMLGGDLQSVAGGAADLGMIQTTVAPAPVKMEAKAPVKDEAPVKQEDTESEDVEQPKKEAAEKETDQGQVAQAAAVQQAPKPAAQDASSEGEVDVTDVQPETVQEAPTGVQAQPTTAGDAQDDALPQFQLQTAEVSQAATQQKVSTDAPAQQVVAEESTAPAVVQEVAPDQATKARPAEKPAGESYYAIQRSLESADEGTQPVEVAQEAPVQPVAVEKPVANTAGDNAGQAAALAQSLAARASAGGEQTLSQVSGKSGSESGTGGITAVGILNQTSADKLAPAKGKPAVNGLPPKDQQKVVDQVKELLQKAIQNRDGNTLTVRLNPPELGQMTVKVTQRESQVYARIIPESPDVEAALRSRAGDVTQVLVAAGLKPDQVLVSIGRERSGAESLQFQQFMAGSDAGGRQDGRERAGGWKGDGMPGGFGNPGQMEEESADSGWIA